MEDMEKWKKACAISASALREAKRIAKPGVRLLELAEKVEGYMREHGAKPAFPFNISLNETAAHFTPEFNDEAVLDEKDIVKLDLGAHIDGFPGDNALTVDFSGENGKLVESVEAALDSAVSLVRAGAKTNALGEAIEKEIRSRGFKPIENLSGHSIKRYRLHAGMDVPNIRTTHGNELKEGDVIAIEPFATNGAGHVTEGAKVEIFSLLSKRPVRMQSARNLQDHMEKAYEGLPFAERWLYAAFPSRFAVQNGIRELAKAGALRQYPVLMEAGKGLVAQKEYTVLVEKDSCVVLTK